MQMPMIPQGRISWEEALGLGLRTEFMDASLDLFVAESFLRDFSEDYIRRPSLHSALRGRPQGPWTLIRELGVIYGSRQWQVPCTGWDVCWWIKCGPYLRQWLECEEEVPALCVVESWLEDLNLPANTAVQVLHNALFLLRASIVLRAKEEWSACPWPGLAGAAILEAIIHLQEARGAQSGGPQKVRDAAWSFMDSDWVLQAGQTMGWAAEWCACLRMVQPFWIRMDYEPVLSIYAALAEVAYDWAVEWYPGQLPRRSSTMAQPKRSETIPRGWTSSVALWKCWGVAEGGMIPEGMELVTSALQGRLASLCGMNEFGELPTLLFMRLVVLMHLLRVEISMGIVPVSAYDAEAESRLAVVELQAFHGSLCLLEEKRHICAAYLAQCYWQYTMIRLMAQGATYKEAHAECHRQTPESYYRVVFAAVQHDSLASTALKQFHSQGSEQLAPWDDWQKRWAH